MRRSFETSVTTERLSAFGSSSSSSPTSIINLSPVSVFSFDGGFFWTGAWVIDGVGVDAGVCVDDGVVYTIFYLHLCNILSFILNITHSKTYLMN